MASLQNKTLFHLFIDQQIRCDIARFLESAVPVSGVPLRTDIENP
jgi:hypothetical protein